MIRIVHGTDKDRNPKVREFEGIHHYSPGKTRYVIVMIIEGDPVIYSIDDPKTGPGILRQLLKFLGEYNREDDFQNISFPIRVFEEHDQVTLKEFDPDARVPEEEGEE